MAHFFNPMHRHAERYEKHKGASVALHDDLKIGLWTGDSVLTNKLVVKPSDLTIATIRDHAVPFTHLPGVRYHTVTGLRHGTIKVEARLGKDGPVCASMPLAVRTVLMDAGGSTLSNLHARFSAILNSAACQNIDFTYGPLSVSRSGFRLVAQALERSPPHNIAINVVTLNANVEAAYDHHGNFVSVPHDQYGTTPYERMIVVHECVHAIAKITQAGIDAEREETAAFIAGALYNIYCAASPSGPLPYDPRKDDNQRTAHNVAVQIAGKCVTLTDEITDRLRETVRKRYKWPSPSWHYENNGI
jgi:hypothetical protein